MGIEKLAKQNISHFWKDAGDVVLPEMKLRYLTEHTVDFRSFPNSIHLLKTTVFLAAESDEIEESPLLVVPPFLLDKTIGFLGEIPAIVGLIPTVA